MSEAGWNKKDYEILGDKYVENAHESQKWHALWKDLPKYDEDGNVVTYTITEKSGSSGYTVNYGKNADNTTATSVVLTVDANNSNRMTGSLTNVQEDSKIDIDIVKVDADNITKTLTGAKFELYKVNTSQQSDKIMVETYVDSNGKITITGLGEGTYRLVETKCPDGYVKTSTDPVFEIQKGTGSNLTVVIPTGSITLVHQDATGTGNDQILVKNTAGKELPNSGGIGTTIFYILGSILVIGGGIYFISRRRIK